MQFFSLIFHEPFRTEPIFPLFAVLNMGIRPGNSYRQHILSSLPFHRPLPHCDTNLSENRSPNQSVPVLEVHTGQLHETFLETVHP
jgi:hypothetical protein